jgi:hypothetical protein
LGVNLIQEFVEEADSDGSPFNDHVVVGGEERCDLHIGLALNPGILFICVESTLHIVGLQAQEA